jgi:hypothetical protein
MEIVYSASDVGPHRADVAWTWERFGNSKLREPLRTSSFASPLLLVKPGLLEVFRRSRVRGLEFEPINVV